jgi:hypothetical protein
MKSFTNTVETMDRKKKKQESTASKSSGVSSLPSMGNNMLKAASMNEQSTQASSLTGMSLSAKSSMSANFLNAATFKSFLLVTKTIATIFLIWVAFKLLTKMQGKRGIPQIMMGGNNPAAPVAPTIDNPVVISLDYSDFSDM